MPLPTYLGPKTYKTHINPLKSVGEIYKAPNARISNLPKRVWLKIFGWYSRVQKYESKNNVFIFKVGKYSVVARKATLNL